MVLQWYYAIKFLSPNASLKRPAVQATET